MLKENLQVTLDFLGLLQAHNNREWFEKNRAAYEQARESFEIFVDRLIHAYGRTEDFKGVAARDCIFRIYRDVRFSKDKSPYKTNMGALIAAGGRRSGRQGYYFHLAPHDESMIAGGLYMPSGEEIGKFRRAIARDARPFKQIIGARDFKKYFGTLEPEKLKNAPLGVPRDHPEIELLKWKQVVVRHRLGDEQVSAPDLVPYAVRVFKAMKPFLDYLNSILE
jgi:uncharacterized protein (TIGR02453 family)